VTTWFRIADVLVWKFGFPPYEAVIGCVLADRDVVVKLAVPALSDTVASGVDPS
jgi:hypothetical protein